MALGLGLMGPCLAHCISGVFYSRCMLQVHGFWVSKYIDTNSQRQPSQERALRCLICRRRFARGHPKRAFCFNKCINGLAGSARALETYQHARAFKPQTVGPLITRTPTNDPLFIEAATSESRQFAIACNVLAVLGVGANVGSSISAPRRKREHCPLVMSRIREKTSQSEAF